VFSRHPSTVYQRIGDVLVSLGCEQSRETSRPRISASHQPGISHIDVPAGNVLRKQLYSGRSEPPDDDDDSEIKRDFGTWYSICVVVLVNH